MASERIQVVVRFRPHNDSEKAQGGESCVKLCSTTELSITGDRMRQYTFDRVLPPDSSQEDLYRVVGKRTIDNVLKGYNGTILAYGQTGSGKTHSMLGPQGGQADVLDASAPFFEQRGIIPRLAYSLFTELQKLNTDEVGWKVHVSVFELYREAIHDLLSERERSSGEYRIREDNASGRGIYIENLYAKPCTTVSELLEAIRVGVARRKVAATSSNLTSSRSHSVTVVTVEQTNHVQNETVVTSRLNLVDLAGSEKVAKTHADGDRLKEAQMINLSLTLLGNVIYKLTDGKSTYIPFRDSKLTRLLQESFGGNAVTTLLCHCSMATFNGDETISTLQFASRAKQIKNKPRVNREMSLPELQRALAVAQDEIRQLRDRLAIGEDLVSKSARNRPSVAVGEGGMATEFDFDQLHATISALMAELEETKRELAEKESDIEYVKLQKDFYLARSEEAEKKLQDANRRAQADHDLMMARIAALEEELRQSKGGANATPAAAHGPEKPNSGSAQQDSSELVRNEPLHPSRPVASGRSSGNSTPTSEDCSLPTRHMVGKKGLLKQRRSRPSLPASAVRVPSKKEDVDGEVVALVPRATMQLQAPQQLEEDWRSRIAELEEELRKMKAANGELTCKVGEQQVVISRLNDQLESANEAKDALQKQLAETKKILEARETENSQMRRILEELGINLEEHLRQLSSERETNVQLRTEAFRLKTQAETLKEASEQQEFCDMASMELVVKTEDVAAVENEINCLTYVSMSPQMRAASIVSLKSTLSALDGFLNTLTTRLQQTFHTSNLEAQRLNLREDVSELLSRSEGAAAQLLSIEMES